MKLWPLGAAWLVLRHLRARPRWKLAGRVVLITGGSRGLGLVLAREFTAAGAAVALVARDAAELERAAADLRTRGGVVQTLTADVTDPEAVQQVVPRCLDHYGRLDVLVNNAGVIETGPLEHMDEADFGRALDTHFWAALRLMRAVVPVMRTQGGGRIINIASIGGRVAVPHLVPYCASKFALVGLSDGFRAELAPANIRVTTVCPGLMRTGSHFNALFKGRHRAEFTWFSILDSLPFTSVSAEHAAREIVSACRRGDPTLVISWQARLATRLAPLFPRTTAALMTLMQRLLPAATGPDGDELRTGWQSQSALAPSVLTALGDAATVANNGLKGHSIDALKLQEDR